MKNLIRKKALIHVLVGGFWFQRQDDQLVMVKMGPLAQKHVNNPRTLAHKVLQDLVPSAGPRNLPIPVAEIDTDREAKVRYYLLFNCSFVGNANCFFFVMCIIG